MRFNDKFKVIIIKDYETLLKVLLTLITIIHTQH